MTVKVVPFETKEDKSLREVFEIFEHEDFDAEIMIGYHAESDELTVMYPGEGHSKFTTRTELIGLLERAKMVIHGGVDA